ncbi:hypothetical protein B0T14DRAFT_517041 [Immersiella caudata]|uniref:Rhodopsin domain-containing protein n=1 Tax=Immersiella caudata TaxID=314043 RepID=A0AA40C3U6_9PEZI|nr:hypothetical protein B0T14DRAFT_517041 [Immersiella caudata]
MAVVIASVSRILGPTRPEFLPFSYITQAAPLSLVAEITSTWSVALLKTSIATMLLRFQRTRGWAVFLKCIIGLQLATAVFITIMQTTRCVPINALWDPTVPASSCWGENAFKISMTTASILVIVTDIIFALIPLTFLHQVRRSLRDRLIIGALMSLGLLASAASVVKTVMVQRFDQTDDPSGHGMSIALWASIEAQVGIIAACIPCLRAASLRFLGRVGILTHATAGSGSKTQGNVGIIVTDQLHVRSGVRLSSRPRGGDAFDGTARNATSTRIAAVSEEDEGGLLEEKRGNGSQRGWIQRKTEIDIELASVGSGVHQ